MSVEEDTELRDLLIKCLESNGILAKLKAQLRASVYLTLEDDNSIKEKIPLTNNICNFLQTKEGKLLFLLIKDFLEHFNLEHTLTVLKAEARLEDLLPDKSQEELINDLGLNIEKIDTKQSVLYNILLNFQNNSIKKNIFDRKFSSTDITCNENLSNDQNSSSVCITPKPITEIRTTVRNIHNKTYTTSDDKNSQTNSPELYSKDVKITDDNENDSFEKDSSCIDECIESVSNENTASNKDDNYLIDFEKSVNLITNNDEIDIEIESEHGILDESLSKIISLKNDVNLVAKELEDMENSESIKSLHSLKFQNSSVSKPLEKTKAFNSLIFLQDLPPVNLNKNKTEILPSLYSSGHDVTIDNEDKKLTTDLLNCDENKSTNS